MRQFCGHDFDFQEAMYLKSLCCKVNSDVLKTGGSCRFLTLTRGSRRIHSGA